MYLDKLIDSVKRAQHLSYLRSLYESERTEVFCVPKVYAECVYDLQRLGLVTDDIRLTEAGKAVLWYQHMVEDPL